MKRIAIVGGGPAGFMASITAAERARAGTAVEVLEESRALATLLPTGGGRCNLTNIAARPLEMAESYPRGGKFLVSALSRFGPRETMAWFQARGLPLAEEEEGRVFPASRRASDVRETLIGEARRAGVAIREACGASAIERQGDRFRLAARGGSEEYDAVILATGGRWREPDSGGYKLARMMGHTVTSLAPSLVGLIAAEEWPGRLAGLTITGARMKTSFQGKKAADERGDFVFTHRGISGPLAFRVSSRYAFIPFSPREPLTVSLSILPGESPAALEEKLADAAAGNGRRSVITVVSGIAPRSLAEVILSCAGVDGRQPCSQLSRAQRRELARLLGSLPLSVVSREKEGEMVTAGGVPLAEIEGKTMESRKTPGLFMCGEMLDLDGFTGGFNLQAAWSTGYLAGLAAADRVSGAGG